MFELKISADGADDLISNIRNLVNAMNGAGSAEPSVEAPKTRRSRKQAEPEGEQTLAQNVDEKGNQQSSNTVEAPSEPESKETAPAGEKAQEPVAELSGPEDMADYQCVKDWIIQEYLNVAFATQPERAAGFRELVSAFGKTSLKDIPQEQWPDVISMAQQKLAEATK